MNALNELRKAVAEGAATVVEKSTTSGSSGKKRSTKSNEDRGSSTPQGRREARVRKGLIPSGKEAALEVTKAILDSDDFLESSSSEEESLTGKSRQSDPQVPASDVRSTSSDLRREDHPLRGILPLRDYVVVRRGAKLDLER